MKEDIIEAKKRSGKIRKIKVDRVKCIGANTCVELAPGVFQLDSEHLAYIVDPDSESDDAIRLAAEGCPILAITLLDEEDRVIYPE